MSMLVGEGNPVPVSIIILDLCKIHAMNGMEMNILTWSKTPVRLPQYNIPFFVMPIPPAIKYYQNFLDYVSAFGLC